MVGSFANVLRVGGLIDGTEVCGHEGGSTLGYKLPDGFVLRHGNPGGT